MTEASGGKPPRPDDGPLEGEDRSNRLTLDLQPGQRVHLTLRAAPSPQGRPTRLIIEGPPGEALPEVIIRRPWLTRGPIPLLARSLHALRARLQAVGLPRALFALSLVLYAITRLYRLADFPIYFFSDEAIHTALAAELLRDGFRDHLGRLLPTYFENVYLYNLSLSVYLQVLPTALFGRSVFVTRAVSALVTLSGAAALALLLRDGLRLRHWWLGVPLLGLAPAWFLHSRTAFETVLMVSFYAWALYFYLHYLQGRPRHLYLAVLFAALAFYSYSPAQLIVPLTALLFLLSGLRFHRRHRSTVLRALGLALLLALPYLRFRLEQPGEAYFQLRLLDSYWLRPIPLREKLANLLHIYAQSLSPAYWFLAHNHDLPRHTMKGYGHLMTWTLPFALLGLAIALRRARRPTFRAILLTLLALPAGAALVGVGITRVLGLVLPLTAFTALGLDAALRRLEPRLGTRAVPALAFALFSLVQVGMLADALRNGPTWYTDYGLGGMQYGARQVFQEVAEHLRTHPDDQVLISPTWANGTEVLLRFFLPDEPRVALANTDGYVERPRDLNEHMLFVLTPEEYRRALEEPKFGQVEVERILPYPDGRPGFYFVRLAYTPEAPALFAAEAEARRRPVVERLFLDGQEVIIEHSRFDAGRIQDLFDGDPFTLARTLEANPARLSLTFLAPRRLSGLRLTTGSMDFELTLRLVPPDSDQTITLRSRHVGLPPDPTVQVNFPDAPFEVQRLEIEVRDINQGEPAKIHLRELELLP